MAPLATKDLQDHWELSFYGQIPPTLGKPPFETAVFESSSGTRHVAYVVMSMRFYESASKAMVWWTSWWTTAKKSSGNQDWYRGRPASRPRKGTKGQNGKSKGRGKAEKDGKGSTKEETAQQVVKAFQPFTSALPKDAPWTSSTPTSRLPKASMLLPEKEEEKEVDPKGDADDEEAAALKEQAIALMSKEVPQELKIALMKFTSKAPAEMTHADIEKCE